MTPQQKRRYSRHILLDGFGPEAQEKILNSKVLVVGAGGLGSPILQYLSAAGVGQIGIVDGDMVSLSNLQRQTIHTTNDISRPKTDSAKEKILALNPDVHVETYPYFISQDNALDTIRPYDFIIDATDNFAAKYIINDACIMLSKPFSIAGVNRYGMQVTTHVVGSACYRCFFPEPPAQEEVETCAMVGVLGSVVGMCGTIQATECIKYLSSIGQLLTNRLLCIDALTMQFSAINIEQNPDCPICGNSPSINQLREYAFKPCKQQ